MTTETDALPFEDEACDIYREMCIDDGFYAEWDDAIAVVRRAIRAIRALPVDERMAAMAMIDVSGPRSLPLYAEDFDA